MPSDRSVAKFEKVYGSQPAASFRMISQRFGVWPNGINKCHLDSRMIVYFYCAIHNQTLCRAVNMIKKVFISSSLFIVTPYKIEMVS